MGIDDRSDNVVLRVDYGLVVEVDKMSSVVVGVDLVCGIAKRVGKVRVIRMSLKVILLMGVDWWEVSLLVHD